MRDKMKKETLLLTGGDQMLARHFVALYSKHYDIKLLTPEPTQLGEYFWDPVEEELDPKALEGVDHILHLPIPSYDPRINTVKNYAVQRFVQSGVLSLIGYMLMEKGTKVKTLVLASSVEYYGNDVAPYIVFEESVPGRDRYAQEYLAMEEEGRLLKIQNLADRVVMLRFGYVLSHYDGILPHLTLGSQVGLAFFFGNGRQILPWVHVSDAARAIRWALRRKEMGGAYNVTAPQWCTSQKISRQAALLRADMAFDLPLPAFILRWLREDLADSFLNGMRVNSRKLCETGFTFNYPTIDVAMMSIYDL